MKKITPSARIHLFTSSCLRSNASLKQPFQYLFFFSLSILFGLHTNAQLIKVYDFAAPTTYNAVSKGYEKPNVGTYFRATGGGTITFGGTSCFGYNISAPTGSSLFIFQATDNVNSIVIKGTGTGSNRTLLNIATATTITGTYNLVAATNTGTIGSGTCGTITCTPNTVIPAGTFMRFTFSGNMNITSLDIDVVPTGTPPTITTNTVTPAQNNAVVNGTVTPGTMPLLASGIIWSTNNTPLDTNLVTRTRNVPSATAAFNNIASGLTPGQTYYTRAYVIDLAKNVYYGQTLQFTTNAATAPTLNTITPYNILPFKATSGGTAIDSGGLAITDKGICWATTPNPTTASAKISNGANGNNFTNILRVLQPATTYYVRAYAINNVGTGYGNELQFTTAAPAPMLIANPLTLSFGNIAYNSAASILNYKLSGYHLNPATGSILINAPAGYTMATSINGTFSNPLNLVYNGGSFVNTTIYVKMSTATYGSMNGVITHSGGGAAAAATDTVNVSGAIIPDPNVSTNVGTDFWTGFGYQERMDRNAGDANETKLSLYISVPVGSPAAVVNVELPGIPGAATFPRQNITVAPGTVVEVTGFPTGDPADEMNPSGLPDTRLYYTGVSKRGIHIYSTNGVPVSVWMHTYAQNNSAAGAMLFPTNTWNNAYTVQAFGGQTNSVQPIGGFSNNSNPNSFFFVVANEDNTPIWFTPSQDILDSSAATIFSDGHAAGNVRYAKNVEHGPIFLNKGQVFNAMGFIQGSGSSANGLDLTGSKVRTDCDKKIAVFGGNGRCLVNANTCSATSGSDHMIQQMFPSVAWGTKYITVPTKTMEFNIFRIHVSDPTTQVWVNNPARTTPLTGLINNQYYQIEGPRPNLIESDKPINVTQFIVAGQCNTSKGFAGDGDPEMIILSPVQQAINNVTVYSAGIKKSSPTANGHYINVIIRKGGIASFRLNGLNTCDTGRSQVGANATTCYDPGGTISIQNAFQKHPSDTNYYYAKFRVAPNAAHRLYSDSVFVAIAYGMGSGESYGYNAGTNIKDLTKPLFIDNPYLPNNTANNSCTNNPITLKAVLPYAPATVTSIKWNMSLVPGITPQADVTINNPTSDSTFITDGVTYYVYKNPTTYTFGSAGSYNITGIVAGTFASQCGSQTPFSFNINISDPGYADFNIQYDPCVSDTVKLFDQSGGNGFNIIKWRWDFGDNTTDTINQNPTKVYASNGVYSIKLRAINSIGCYADTTKALDMTAVLTAKYGVRDTICAGAIATFTDSSSNAGLGGGIVKWTWNFGDATPVVVANTSVFQNHSFANPGVYTVTLVVETSGGCTATFSKQVTVRPNPTANFTPPAGVCLPGSTSFINTTTISDTTINTITYVWNFGDGSPTVTTFSPTHIFPNTTPPTGGYNVLLTATSKYGCVGTKTTPLTEVFTKPVATFTAPPKLCLGDTARFIDNSSGTGQTITKWFWKFGDTTTDTVQNPNHTYTAIGTYQVTLAVQSNKGCVSDTSAAWSIKVNPLPVAGFILPSSCLSSGSITFIDTSLITPNDGTQLPFTYQWNFGNPSSGGANVSIAQNGQHSYTAAGTYPVSLIVTSAQGCVDTTIQPFIITGTRPVANFSVLGSVLCANDSVKISNTSTIAIGTISKVEIIWDDIANPGVAVTDNSPMIGRVYSHKYPTFQTPLTKSYNVRFRSFSGSTCVHDTVKTIIVNASPLTTFGTELGICLNAPIRTLTAGTETSGMMGNFVYSGNGITPPSAFNPATAGAGTHPIKYVYINTAGCRDSSTGNITVWPAAQARFGISSPSCVGNSVVFTDSSTAGAGTITEWRWTMGDGSPVIIRNNNTPFNYTYPTAGNYTVTLQIVTSNGCNNVAGTGSKTITIHPKPVVDFNMPLSICLPNGSGLFSDASTISDGTAASFNYVWTFGDGGTSAVKNTTHIYTAAGSYTVRLRVISGVGCVDSTSKTFSNIFPQPKAAFTVNPITKQICLGDNMNFADASNGMGWPVNEWHWRFGDNGSSLQQNPAYTYANSGNYTVSLYVFNTKGCISDTATTPVIVDDYPIVDGGNEVYVLQGNSITLMPNITGASNNASYLWTPSLYLNSTTVRNPTANPIDDIDYLLQVTNGAGCSGTDTIKVRLFKQPVIPNAFSPNGDGINDRWNIAYLNTYSQARVDVYNRSGQPVFTSQGGYSTPWDGTYKGSPLPVGTYYYIIHLGVISTPIAGSVTILK